MSLEIRQPAQFEAVPEAVLIDLDDTLYAYAPAHQAGLGATRDKVARQLSVEPAKFDALQAEARQQIKTGLGGGASSHSRLLYFQRLLELLGLGSQPLLALDLEQTYWRAYLAGARLFPGVKAFLRELRAAGIRTVVVTDLTAAIQFRKLVYFDLDQDLDYVVTSEESGQDKPQAPSYQLALEKLDLAPGRIWMIGDQAAGDVVGARDHAGAITLQKRHQGVELAPEADLVFDDFGELLGLLQRLIGE